MLKQYINRYGERIMFLEIEDEDTIVVYNYHPSMMGVSGGIVIDNQLVNPTTIDPSGGPVLSVGMDIEYIFGDNISRIIKQLEFQKYHGIILTIERNGKSTGETRSNK